MHLGKTLLLQLPGGRAGVYSPAAPQDDEFDFDARLGSCPTASAVTGSGTAPVEPDAGWEAYCNSIPVATVALPRSAAGVHGRVSACPSPRTPTPAPLRRRCSKETAQTREGAVTRRCLRAHRVLERVRRPVRVEHGRPACIPGGVTNSATELNLGDCADQYFHAPFVTFAAPALSGAAQVPK